MELDTLLKIAALVFAAGVIVDKVNAIEKRLTRIEAILLCPVKITTKE